MNHILDNLEIFQTKINTDERDRWLITKSVVWVQKRFLKLLFCWQESPDVHHVHIHKQADLMCEQSWLAT